MFFFDFKVNLRGLRNGMTVCLINFQNRVGCVFTNGHEIILSVVPRQPRVRVILYFVDVGLNGDDGSRTDFYCLSHKF